MLISGLCILLKKRQVFKMTKTLQATFDGKVLHPDELLHLKPGSRVHLTIVSNEEVNKESHSFLRAAQQLELDGPPDWSVRYKDLIDE